MAAIVQQVRPLGFPWVTQDPFLFCVHHKDDYPAGDGKFGVAPSALRGRQLGSDFEIRDGFRMYHGEHVPGFPQHPHRGFETVTIVRRGYIDHSDSLGAAARFGAGDVQWLTAGAGVVHSEMFPLLSESEPNPLELFQIWLNLPRKKKMATPYFSMLWSEQIPRVTKRDAEGRTAELTVIAGAFEGAAPPAPPPDSWASEPDANILIWSLKLEAGAHFTLPKAEAGVTRSLYFFGGSRLRIGETELSQHAAVTLAEELEVPLLAGDKPCDVLILGGRPIAEPVVQYGPFVMNARAEIQQAMLDYQRTGFGGWPWQDDGPVHGSDAERFARRTDGSVERP